MARRPTYADLARPRKRVGIRLRQGYGRTRENQTLNEKLDSIKDIANSEEAEESWVTQAPTRGSDRVEEETL